VAGLSSPSPCGGHEHSRGPCCFKVAVHRRTENMNLSMKERKKERKKQFFSIDKLSLLFLILDNLLLKTFITNCLFFLAKENANFLNYLNTSK
jgi:hypothetical protein